MKKLWVIARKDILEAFRSRSMYVFIIVMFVLTLSLTAVYQSSISNLAGDAQAIDTQSRLFLNSIAYSLPMMYSIFVCSIFANFAVIVDKAKRTIESLLAAPVSVNEVWVGKSLAVAVPSIIVGLIVAILAYLVIDIVAVSPHTSGFIAPSMFALITAIIIDPILVFSIVLVVINIQLIITNPRIANLVFTAIFILVYFGINIASVISTKFSLYPVIFGGLIIIFLTISYILSRSLTTEKVLLSSKM